MARLFALFVGINQYHPDSGVAPLRGCIADVEAMDAFIRTHYSTRFDDYVPLVLTNSAATRAQVIDAFGESHLMQAGKDDTVLFFYTGHGARERTAAPFEMLVPDGYHESLVCYDSRTANGFDLSDKELAVLLSRLSANGAHVVAILDCCHSGSGTRDTAAELRLGAVRQTGSRQEPRPWDSFLDGWFARTFPQGQGLHLPEGKHVLLAACRRREKAFELTTDRGHFSTHLLLAWEQLGPDASYAALYQRTRQLMMGLTSEQHPQLDTSGFFNPYVAALSGKTTREARRVTVWFEDGHWWAGAGAIHGIATFPDHRPVFDLEGPDNRHVQVEGLRTGAERTMLPPLPDEWKGSQVEARLLSAPSPAMGVYLDADEAGSRRYEQGAAHWQPVHFEWTAEPEAATVVAELRADRLVLRRRADGLVLRTLLGDDDARIFDDALQYLERVGKFHRLLDLDNRATRLPEGTLDWELRTPAGTFRGDEVQMDVADEASAEYPFELQVVNRGTRPLHVAVWYLSPWFGIFRVGDHMWLDGGQRRTFLADTLRLPRDADHALDLFKLVASTYRLDDFEMAQDHLPVGETVTWRRADGTTRSTAGARLIGGFAPPEATADFDWTTSLLRIRLHRTRIAADGRVLSAAGSPLRVLPHPEFRAGIRLLPLPPARALGSEAFLHELARREGAELLALDGNARSLAGPACVLELDTPTRTETLTQRPLELELDHPLADDEHLLCLSWDGTHLLPLGEVEEGTRTRILLHHLPEPQTRGRSLGGAIRLFFLKVSGLGTTHRLRRVVYESAHIERTDAGLVQAVASAKRILLLVHGIIGDTRHLAEATAPLLERGACDLILTFDYENLHTPIEETAAILREQLRAAGLTTDGPPRLTIVAHSMGGLVSRWFVENLGGHRMVRRLIMAGTPNGGSDLARVTAWRDIAQWLLAFAVNSGWGFPAAATLAALLNRSRQLTRTLEQMHPERSPLLDALHHNPDPGVPYHIVAGDFDAFRKNDPDAASLADKLAALGSRLFFGGTPNDMAVRLDAIEALPAGWKQVSRHVLAAHHLNYFSHPPVRKLVWQLLGTQ